MNTDFPEHFIKVPESQVFFKNYWKYIKEDPCSLVFILANVKGDTGKSWCPDCVSVWSAIHDTILPNAKCPSYYMTVTRDEWRGNKNHPYRDEQTLGAEGVPTVLLYRKGQLAKKLDDETHFADKN